MLISKCSKNPHSSYTKTLPAIRTKDTGTMRLKLSIIFLLLISFQNIYSQKTNWGLTIGIIDSKINSLDKHLIKDIDIGPEAYYRVKAKSINLGLFVQKEINEILGIESGLNLNTRGGRYLYDDFDDQLLFIYLDIPQVIRLQIPNDLFSFYLDLGQSLGVAMIGSFESYSNTYPPAIQVYDISLGQDYKRFDYSLIFGAGMSMNKVGKGRLFFQYRFFKDMIDGSKSQKVKENYINYSIFNVGYTRSFRTKN